MPFFLAGIGQYGLIAALIAGLLVTVATWRTVDIKKHEAAGAQKVVAKIERATDNAISAGRAAAEKSRSAPPAAPKRVQSIPPGYGAD